MYTGATKNLAVIGYPIAHSLSPVIQNTALTEAGLDYAYIAIPVAPEALPSAVAGFRAMNFRGWNVTIPHKSAIIPLLDEIEPAAAALGAVNTVINNDGHLIGTNTDVIGFIEPLKARLGENGLKGKNAVLLGAGGAARAVLWALLSADIKNITIAVRTPSKAEPLAEEFRRLDSEHFSGTAAITVVDWAGEEYPEALAGCDLLINATPLGMAPRTEAAPPVDWQKLKAEAFCYDIIYTPAVTCFLSQAAEHGHATLNGEEMLVGQARAALEKWTGCPGDKAAMLKALRRALEK
ncbi:MAG: shikimate dehydrogenase [Selenomonadaceae bacterium]|nr:shikimate dehydrogenase [Selenomonadaceae bacterium]